MTDPFGIGSFYCHPMEQFFVNAFPLVLGPILIGAHLSTMYRLWFVMAFASQQPIHIV